MEGCDKLKLNKVVSIISKKIGNITFFIIFYFIKLLVKIKEFIVYLEEILNFMINIRKYFICTLSLLLNIIINNRDLYQNDKEIKPSYQVLRFPCKYPLQSSGCT